MKVRLTMEITRHTPTFATSPQLHADDLSDCAARGFALIINNRPDGEEAGQPCSGDLAREAKRLGLGYAHIPIVPGQMTDLDAREMGDVLSAAKGPVLAFCRTGNRSQQLWNRAGELGLAPD